MASEVRGGAKRTEEAAAQVDVRTLEGADLALNLGAGNQRCHRIYCDEAHRVGSDQRVRHFQGHFSTVGLAQQHLLYVQPQRLLPPPRPKKKKTLAFLHQHTKGLSTCHWRREALAFLHHLVKDLSTSSKKSKSFQKAVEPRAPADG